VRPTLITVACGDQLIVSLLIRNFPPVISPSHCARSAAAFCSCVVGSCGTTIQHHARPLSARVSIGPAFPRGFKEFRQSLCSSAEKDIEAHKAKRTTIPARHISIGTYVRIADFFIGELSLCLYGQDFHYRTI